MNREPLSQLRQKLRELDYHETLVPEAHALVAHLLSDVEAASSKSGQLASKLSKLEQELSKSRDLMFPLKRENARLVRENNQLHLELIKQTESIDKRERDLALQIKKYQGEAQTAAFMLNQNQKRLENQENEGGKLRAKLDRILGSRDVVTITAGKHSVLEQGVPSDNEPLTESSIHNSKKTKESEPNPLAISRLQNRINELEEEKLKLEATLRDANERVALRDKEIKRLGIALEQSVENDRHGAQHINRSNAQILEQMTDQMDFLTAQLAESQTKLAAATVESRKLNEAELLVETSNAEKEKALKEIEQLKESVDRLETELASARRDLSEQKNSPADDVGMLIDAYQNDKQKYASEVRDLEAEIASKNSELEDLNAKYEKECQSRAVLESKLNDAIDAKASLSKDVELLEASLVQLKTSQSQQAMDSGESGTQFGVLDLRSELGKAQLRNQDQEKDNAFLRSELDRTRVSVSELQNEVSNLERELASRSRALDAEMEKATRVQNLLQTSQTERMQLQHQIDDMVAQVQSTNSKERQTRLQCDELVADRDSARSRLAMAEEEIKHLTTELSTRSRQVQQEAGARLELEGLNKLPGVVNELEEQVKRWRIRAGEMDSESRRLAREVEFEKRQAEDLKRDRNALEQKLNYCKDELESSRIQCRSLEVQVEQLNSKCNSLKGDASHFQSLVSTRDAAIGEKVQSEAHLVAELDATKEELQKCNVKLDACTLRERLLQDQVKDLQSKLQVELQASKKLQDAHSSLQQEVRRQAGMMEIHVEERNRLREQCSSLATEKEDKAKSLRELQSKLGNKRNRCVELESQVEQLKSLFAQLDSTREGLESRLKESRASLERETRSRRDAESKLEQTLEGLRREEQKTRNMDKTTTELTEKLQAAQKSVRQSESVIDQLSTAMKSQESHYRDLEKKLGSATLQLHSQSEALGQREEELERVRAEYGALEKRCMDSNAMVELRQRELRSASQDLANMTRENQSMNASVQGLRSERDRVQAELGDATSRIARMEGLLESAKLEKEDLTKLYRRVCEENQRLKHTVQDLTTARSAALHDHHNQAGELSVARKQVAELEESRRKQWIELQALQRQVGELTRRLHDSQTRLVNLSEERNEAAATAESVRDTTKSLVETQDNLRWELGQAKAQSQELGRRMEELQQERAQLVQQLEQERRRVRDMEAVVNRAREREAQAVLSQQDKEHRIASLQTQLMQMSVGGSPHSSSVTSAGALGPSPIQVASKSASSQHSEYQKSKHQSDMVFESAATAAPLGSDSAQSESGSSSSSTLQRKMQDLETLISEQTKTIWDIGRDNVAES